MSSSLPPLSNVVGCHYDTFLDVIWRSPDYNEDIGQLLARAIWGTCSDKPELLTYAMQDEIACRTSTSKNQKSIFLEAILAYDLNESSQENSGDFAGLQKCCEERYNHILDKIISRRLLVENDRDPASSLESSLPTSQGDEFARKRIRLRSKSTSPAFMNGDYLSTGILLNVDMLYAKNRAQILRKFHLDTNASFIEVPCTAAKTTKSKKGKELLRLSNENQTIALVVACAYTLICSIDTQIQEVVVNLGLHNNEFLMLEMHRILGGVAVDLLKVFAFLCFRKQEYVFAMQKTFTEFFEKVWSKLYSSHDGNVAQDSIWKIVTSLDDRLAKGVNEMFFEFLSSLGLAVRNAEGQRKLNEHGVESHYTLNTRCHTIFQASWAESVKYLLNGAYCPNVQEKQRVCFLGAGYARENILNELKRKFYPVRDLGTELGYFKKQSMEKNNLIQIIVEQSFQVFVVCSQVKFYGKSAFGRQIIMDDIWTSLEKKYALPLRFLGQFADLNSVTSSGRRELTEDGVLLAQVLVIGNLNRASIMRGLLRGVNISHMLDFLNICSPLGTKEGSQTGSVSDQNTLSTYNPFVHNASDNASFDSSFRIPSVVVRQIQHWYTESRRLVCFSYEGVIKKRRNTDQCKNTYPYSSFWWNLIAPGIDIKQLCTPSFFLKPFDAPIIIGGVSNIIQTCSDSQAEKSPSHNASLQKQGRACNTNRNYASSHISSDDYGEETMDSILHHFEHEHLILVVFDSVDEVRLVFGCDIKETPLHEIRSTLPNQKDYQFLSRINELKYLAKVM